jgi:hypothetical protein
MDGFQQNYAFFVDFLPCFGTMASAWLKQLIMLMMFGIMGIRSLDSESEIEGHTVSWSTRLKDPGQETHYQGGLKDNQKINVIK